MAELQFTIEFSIELHKFVNVDLFQRGFYQIRTLLRVCPKLLAKTEVILPRNSSSSLVFPACVVNGTAVSKTFQILYKNEEVQLDDVALFKIHVLVDGNRVRDSILKSDFQLHVELWFTDQNFGPEHHKTIQCVSSRLLILHFDPAKGLHHHIPILFDYFHLSAVTVSIHASLLGLCQPYLTFPRSSKGHWFVSSPRLSSRRSISSSLETVLFGPQHSSAQSIARLQRGHLKHWDLCSLLLSAYKNLQNHLLDYVKLLPPWQQLQLENLNGKHCIENLSEMAKECYSHVQSENPLQIPWEKVFKQTKSVHNEEDFLALSNNDLSQLCGALIVLWQQFLEIVHGQEKIRQHLSRQHHFQRIKRFAEGYFIVEKPRISALSEKDESTQFYEDVTDALRRSQYLNLLPPLEVECPELDGDCANLPIIYEEHYQDFYIAPSNCRSQSCLDISDVRLQVHNKSIEEVCSQAAKKSTVVVPKSQASNKSFDNYASSEQKVSLKEVLININQKNPQRTKVKLKTRTVGFLRQLKRTNLNASCSSVTLLTFKKFDINKTSTVFSQISKNVHSVKNGIRHSQSALSVMRSLCARQKRSFINSESMPDLTSDSVPPPPPPPRGRFASADLCLSFDNLLLDTSSESCCSSRNNSLPSGSPIKEDVPLPSKPSMQNFKHKRSVSSSQVFGKVSDLSISLSTSQKDSRKNSLDDVFLKNPEPNNTASTKPSLKLYCNSDTILESESAEETLKENGADDICPTPPPPLQFRDPPKEEKNEEKANQKQANSSERTPFNPPSFVCEGTVFFPKPPAEFAENSSESTPPKKEENPQPQQKIEKSLDNSKVTEETSFYDTKCTVLEMFSTMCESSQRSEEEEHRRSSFGDDLYRTQKLMNAFCDDEEECALSLRRASIGLEVISFVKAKEEFKKQLNMPWLWCSDFPSLASKVPYFQCDSDLRAFSPEGLHLVICVHGLDGNSADLRLVRTYLELGLPTVNFEFLMSERNQGETFEDFETMTDRLVQEIKYHIEVFSLKPCKISFIGHSLGNIIIRSALVRPEMKPYLGLLHTFLSLSGPHLGTLFNNSGLVNMGMWFMQKWKKSGSLLQLALKDGVDIRETFLYKLSQKPGLEYFKNVLLFGSSQDRYVPMHSARIEMCKAALKDTSPIGAAYREMVNSLLIPLIKKTDINLVRFNVHHALPSSANSLIGRAAHIAVLDSEVFIEKFMVVTGLKYFV